MYEHVEFEEVKRDDTLVVEVGGSKQVTLNFKSRRSTRSSCMKLPTFQSRDVS